MQPQNRPAIAPPSLPNLVARAKCAVTLFSEHPPLRNSLSILLNLVSPTTLHLTENPSVDVDESTLFSLSAVIDKLLCTPATSPDTFNIKHSIDSLCQSLHERGIPTSFLPPHHYAHHLQTVVCQLAPSAEDVPLITQRLHRVLTALPLLYSFLNAICTSASTVAAVRNALAITVQNYTAPTPPLSSARAPMRARRQHVDVRNALSALKAKLVLQSPIPSLSTVNFLTTVDTLISPLFSTTLDPSAISLPPNQTLDGILAKKRDHIPATFTVTVSTTCLIEVLSVPFYDAPALLTVVPYPSKESDGVFAFEEEVLLLRTLIHPCLPCFYGVHTYPSPYHPHLSSETMESKILVVTEHLPYTLRSPEALEALKPLSSRLQILRDVAHAVQHLHCAGVRHGSLIPYSVRLRLVEGKLCGRAKVDLTSLLTNAASQSLLPPVLEPAFAPPEALVCSDEGCFTRDIWAFGMLIAFLFHDDVASFDNTKVAVAVWANNTQTFVDSVLNGVSYPACKQLMRQCLKIQPGERLNIGDVTSSMDVIWQAAGLGKENETAPVTSAPAPLPTAGDDMSAESEDELLDSGTGNPDEDIPESHFEPPSATVRSPFQATARSRPSGAGSSLVKTSLPLPASTAPPVKGATQETTPQTPSAVPEGLGDIAGRGTASSPLLVNDSGLNAPKIAFSSQQSTLAEHFPGRTGVAAQDQIGSEPRSYMPFEPSMSTPISTSALRGLQHRENGAPPLSQPPAGKRVASSAAVRSSDDCPASHGAPRGAEHEVMPVSTIDADKAPSAIPSAANHILFSSKSTSAQHIATESDQQSWPSVQCPDNEDPMSVNPSQPSQAGLKSAVPPGGLSPSCTAGDRSTPLSVSNPQPMSALEQGKTANVPHYGNHESDTNQRPDVVLSQPAASGSKPPSFPSQQPNTMSPEVPATVLPNFSSQNSAQGPQTGDPSRPLTVSTSSVLPSGTAHPSQIGAHFSTTGREPRQQSEQPTHNARARWQKVHGAGQPVKDSISAQQKPSTSTTQAASMNQISAMEISTHRNIAQGDYAHSLTLGLLPSEISPTFISKPPEGHAVTNTENATSAPPEPEPSAPVNEDPGSSNIPIIDLDGPSPWNENDSRPSCEGDVAARTDKTTNIKEADVRRRSKLKRHSRSFDKEPFYSKGGDTDTPSHPRRRARFLAPYSSSEEEGDVTLDCGMEKTDADIIEGERINAEAERYLMGDGVTHDLRKAFSLFNQAAEFGCAQAHFNLASSLENGRGVEVDEDEAEKHYKSAAKLGHAEAQLKAGESHERSGTLTDKQVAFYWFSEASKRGLDKALFKVGQKLENGDGVEKDVKAAFNTYVRAREKGNADASYVLADMFECGRGTDVNLQSTLDCYAAASSKGHQGAMVKLGKYYESGHLVDMDKELAFSYFFKASQIKGDFSVEAAFSAGKCLEMGDGVTKNSMRALSLYKTAASGENYEAVFRIGLMYESGDAGRVDMNMAVSFWKNAASKGFTDAYIKLGECADHGKGLKKSAGEALKWYQKAIAKESGEACVAAGWLHERGRISGGRKKEKAAEFYEKGLKLGSVRAVGLFGQCFMTGYGIQTNIEKGLELFKLGASKNDPLSMQELGDCYRDGIGMVVNATEAYRLYEEAAKGGHADSQVRLAECLLRGAGVSKDVQRAMLFIDKAIEQNCGDGYRFKGEIYQEGKYVDADIEEAMVCYRKAADLENTSAMFILGTVHEGGNNGTVDLKRAFYWYKKAADRNCSLAMNNLGVMCEKGHGVKKSHQKAVSWYSKGVEYGSIDAASNLADCYMQGHGVEKNVSRAIELYREAAEGGDMPAKTEIGKCYLDGKGLRKDVLKGIQLLEEASASSEPEAMRRLGVALIDGVDLPEDAQRGLQLLHRAVELGNPEANVDLGRCRYFGRGTEKDSKEAHQWFERALENGNTTATSYLSNMFFDGEGAPKDYERAFTLCKQSHLSLFEECERSLLSPTPGPVNGNGNKNQGNSSSHNPTNPTQSN